MFRLWIVVLLFLGQAHQIMTRNLFQQVMNDEKNLARNLITINLLPRKLPQDKQEMLETKLRLQLASKLWAPKRETVSTGELALYVQGLKASCENPRNFYGHDVVSELGKSIRHNLILDFVEEQLALFTLCLMSKDSQEFELLIGPERFEHLLRSQEQPNLLSNYHSTTSTHEQEVLVTNSTMDSLLWHSLVVSCYSKLKLSNDTLRNGLNDLLAHLLMRQNSDGSFGNHSIQTTALAVQAFIDSGLDRLASLWNRTKAVNFINSNLHFGERNSMDAYFIVPAFHQTWYEIGCRNDLAGYISEEEIRNTQSWTNAIERTIHPKGISSDIKVTMSRLVEDQSGRSEHKVSFNVQPGSSLLKAIKKAVDYNNTVFNFETKEASLGSYIGQFEKDLKDKMNRLIYNITSGEWMPFASPNVSYNQSRNKSEPSLLSYLTELL